jgi:hypothetical protein
VKAFANPVGDSLVEQLNDAIDFGLGHRGTFVRGAEPLTPGTLLEVPAKLYELRRSN